MGWKTSALLISPADLVSDALALRFAGVSDLTPIDTVTVEDVFYPDDQRAALARFGGGKVVFGWENLGELVDWGSGEGVDATAMFARDLPTALAEASHGGQIAYAALHSVVNYYGFALWRDGALVRALAGVGSEGAPLPYLSLGAETPCERRTFEDLASDDIGPDSAEEWRRLFTTGPIEIDDEILSHDQIGEEIILNLFEDFVGENPSSSQTGGEEFFAQPATLYRAETLKGKHWLDPPA